HSLVITCLAGYYHQHQNNCDLLQLRIPRFEEDCVQPQKKEVSNHVVSCEHLVVIMFVVDLLPSTGSHTQILNDLQMQVNSSNLTHSLQKGSSSNKEESKDMHETFISTEKTAVTENIILLSETQSDISIETINPTVTTSILTYITKSSQLGNASSLSPQSDSSTLKPSYPPLSTSFLVPPSNHSANTSNKCNNETDLFLKRIL
ncbi:hypothetical protein C0J52_04363, partial [Blattella germanica]